MTPFGRKAPPPAMGIPEPLEKPTLPKGPPKPSGADEPDGDEGDLTPEMLDYSGSEEQCGKCKHFTAPSTCDRWSAPVEEAGHCEGFQPGGEDTGEAAGVGAGDSAGSEEDGY